MSSVLVAFRWAVLLWLGVISLGFAQATPMTLPDCLKKTEGMPDLAAADADLWIKEGGGFDAQLCHAFAQFRRNEFKSAGEEFAALAHGIDAKQVRQKASLYAQAAAAFTRAQDRNNADSAFGAALKLDDRDPEIWMDRALARAAVGSYWDAIADASQALKLNPKNVDALRLRGQAWVKLGNEPMAREDFLAAEDISPSPLVVDKK